MKPSLGSMLFRFLFLLAGFTLVVAQCGVAQRGRLSIDDRMKILREKVKLTDVQADSIRVIYQRADDERKILFESQDLERNEMRDRMRAIADKADKQIEALLTDEQKTQFDQYRKEQPRMRRMPPETRPRD